jgi:hypothetical protein
MGSQAVTDDMRALLEEAARALEELLPFAEFGNAAAEEHHVTYVQSLIAKIRRFRAKP